jgi:hypothetical protein
MTDMLGSSGMTVTVMTPRDTGLRVTLLEGGHVRDTNSDTPGLSPRRGEPQMSRCRGAGTATGLRGGGGCNLWNAAICRPEPPPRRDFFLACADFKQSLGTWRCKTRRDRALAVTRLGTARDYFVEMFPERRKGKGGGAISTTLKA